MNIDWVIAIVVFMVFVGWGFAYYSSLFEERADVLVGQAEDISDKVVGFLSVDFYKLPVVYDSGNDTSNQVLYFDYTWPDGTKNSTRIFSNGTGLDCMFDGDRIYWQSDVAAGENHFRMEYYEANASLNCDDGILTDNSSQAIPFVAETGTLVSEGKINQMLGMNYDDFRAFLEIHEGFRVELDTGTTQTFGPEPPPTSNIFAKERKSRIAETGDSVKIRVLVW